MMRHSTSAKLVGDFASQHHLLDLEAHNMPLSMVLVFQAFLEASSYSTVEEVQEFANTKTPSPPWVHVVRLLVPMSSCDDAAKILITALGGEEEARRITGGLKWWQVRGVQGYVLRDIRLPCHRVL